MAQGRPVRLEFIPHLFRIWLPDSVLIVSIFQAGCPVLLAGRPVCRLFRSTCISGGFTSHPAKPWLESRSPDSLFFASPISPILPFVLPLSLVVRLPVSPLSQLQRLNFCPLSLFSSSLSANSPSIPLFAATVSDRSFQAISALFRQNNVSVFINTPASAKNTMKALPTGSRRKVDPDGRRIR